MSYTLRFAKPFLKTIKSLDQATIWRIHQRLQELAEDPCNPRISGQVEMQQGERRSRVGDWRIFYELNEANHIIDILAVRPRQRAYKKKR
jgi:mRNA-degrading endonuclease RelE of RelBE toxin-antitoxin system